MAPAESPPDLPRGGVAPAERDADRLVVRVRGEQDMTTAAALSESLAGQIALDDRDLVIDLSEVRFMDASTIGVIVQTCGQLRRRSRSLTLRSPSMFARRLLDICGLADLVDPAPVGVTTFPGAGGALGTWVAVPVVDPVDQRGGEAVPGPGRLNAGGVAAAANVRSVDTIRREDTPRRDMAVERPCGEPDLNVH
jgi:anti-anti-sigma factor